MQAFMKAFDYSGFEVVPKPKRVCNYNSSLVGRDIKAFAQMALITLEPFLSAAWRKGSVDSNVKGAYPPIMPNALYFPNSGF